MEVKKMRVSECLEQSNTNSNHSNSYRVSYSNSSQSQHHRIDQLFKTCDTKGTGLIGPVEFSELCTTFGISDDDSRVIFVDLDHDGDGQIDFEDFSFGFRDFLTPGSRRGSFQVNLVDGTNAVNQLMEMGKKHASAKTAWKHFVSNVGETNIQSFVPKFGGEQLYGIMEDLRNEKNGEVSSKLENALTSLISDVQTLHDEYKTLENTFRKEREVHSAQLAALGEELDHQLAKAELRAKTEAREEAQRQMDAERKKIATEMEEKLGELSAQMKTFEKVEEWLTDEETREKKFRTIDESSKRIETESENRNLRSALVEAQMKATLLQTQLAQKRNEYIDLYQEFHSEKVAASEYRNQCDLMQNHLSILSQANRVLSDANDCFSNINNSPTSGMSLQAEMGFSRSSPTHVRSASDEIQMQPLTSKSALLLHPETDKEDSGRDTLLGEIREGRSSNSLPSERWSSSISSPDMSSRQSVLSCQSPPGVMQSSEEKLKLDLLSVKPIIPERTFKVILAGDASVGKTSFIERACSGHFVGHLSSTIGMDFSIKTLEVDGRCISLQLWDTAGQERFRSLTKSYFRRADGVILMYDVTNERSFVSIRHWIQDVEEGAGRQIPVVLCGNKIDLRDDIYKGATCVTKEDGTRLGRQCGVLFIETSPKKGANIIEALLLLSSEMSLIEDAELLNSVQLKALDDEKVKKKSCCSGGSSVTRTSSSTSNNNSTYRNYDKSY